jgi:CheY-like chemotaxis protein
VIKPVNVLEAVARGKLRIKDAKLRRNFTPMEFFFGEAQEKEGGRRTGVFKFYHNQTQQQVGEVYIEEGKVVYCTYGNAIKEDAFMSICSQRNLSFMFQDLPGAPRKTILASITGLIMEAAKLMDEIADNETGKTVYRVMIVDRDRIPRIVASRLLNQDGFATNVLGVDDVSLVIFEKIKPHCLVVDHLDAEEVLTKLWPDGHLITDIPVILYTTREAKEKIERIKSHAIQGLVEKGKSQTMLASEVRNVLGITL